MLGSTSVGLSDGVVLGINVGKMDGHPAGMKVGIIDGNSTGVDIGTDGVIDGEWDEALVGIVLG